jgi:hypothetical protein
MIHVSFKLTVNRPATQAFWVEGMTGMIVRMNDIGVAFQPSAEIDPTKDFVPGKDRPRGGLEFMVAGRKGADLLKALEDMSAPSRPYFRLRRLADGWLIPEHYDFDGDPPRTEPHLRLWLPHRDVSLPAPLPEHSALAYADVVRHASEVVAAWQRARRPGRMPRDVEDARAVLDDFVTLVRQIRPVLLIEGLIDLDAVRRARDALSTMLEGNERHGGDDG